MIDTFAVLFPQNFFMTSIGLKMYLLLTKNSARGAVRFSDRLGGIVTEAKTELPEVLVDLAELEQHISYHVHLGFQKAQRRVEF